MHTLNSIQYRKIHSQTVLVWCQPSQDYQKRCLTVAHAIIILHASTWFVGDPNSETIWLVPSHTVVKSGNGNSREKVRLTILQDAFLYAKPSSPTGPILIKYWKGKRVSRTQIAVVPLAKSLHIWDCKSGFLWYPTWFCCAIAST